MNIKDYRNNELRMFVMSNILMVLLLSNSLHLSDCFSTIKVNSLASIVNSAMFSGIIYSFIMVMDFCITSNIKMRAVYYYGQMPGETIFSDLLDNKYEKDYRLCIRDVREKYSKIIGKIEDPTLSKKELGRLQNVEWYKIYSKYEDHQY